MYVDLFLYILYGSMLTISYSDSHSIRHRLVLFHMQHFTYKH